MWSPRSASDDIVTSHEDGGRSELSAAERNRLEQRASVAEWLTIAWNVLEMAVSIGLGIAARSLALVAFGFDSMIEVFASLVVIWHLRHPDRAAGRIVARALRLVALAFFALSLSLGVAAVFALAAGHVPEESPLGIAYLSLTVVVMLGLAFSKRRLGHLLGSRPLLAESGMSFLDAVLAASVLLGLAVNAVFGWWWADALAALLIAIAALNEGFENWREAGELANPEA